MTHDQLTQRRKIRILLADDHRIIRRGIASLLSDERDVEVVGEADNGKMAVEMVELYQPDIVIMDVNMPAMNGIDATRTIHDRHPEVKIIGMSMYERADMAETMISAGASDYVAKDSPVEVLMAAIRNATQE